MGRESGPDLWTPKQGSVCSLPTLAPGLEKPEPLCYFWKPRNGWFGWSPASASRLYQTVLCLLLLRGPPPRPGAQPTAHPTLLHSGGWGERPLLTLPSLGQMELSLFMGIRPHCP